MDIKPAAQTSKQQEVCVTAKLAKTEAQTVRSSEDCNKQPMAQAIRLIGDVWILLIVINLLPGMKRFNELLDAMGRVSSKTLSQRLKMLEVSGMVERRAFYEIPPRVEYHLTEKGRDLGKIVEEIEQFAQKHLSGPDEEETNDGSACNSA